MVLDVDSVHALPRRSLHLPSLSAVAKQQAAGEMMKGGEAWGGKELGAAYLPYNQFYSARS